MLSGRLINNPCNPLIAWAHTCISSFNASRPRQDGPYFPDDIFKCIFLNENVSIAIKMSLKFIPMGPINNIPALVQIMPWRRPGDKPLSEPMIVSFTDTYMRHSASMSLMHWGQNGRHFADNIFKYIFSKENLLIKIEMKFVHEGLFNPTHKQTSHNVPLFNRNVHTYALFVTKLCIAGCRTGARPTKNISIEFEIRWKFKTLWCKIYAADHNDILHTSRQCHCRDVCKVSLWSVEYIRN